MRIALDTNILVYAESAAVGTREDAARALVMRLPAEHIALPAQVIGELFSVLTRKLRMPAPDARRIARRWLAACDILPTTADALDEAIRLVEAHRFSVWDAVILAAAARAGCRYLLSEDMQDGFAWHGTTTANPFAAALPPALEALANSGR